MIKILFTIFMKLIYLHETKINKFLKIHLQKRIFRFPACQQGRFNERMSVSIDLSRSQFYIAIKSI